MQFFWASTQTPASHSWHPVHFVLSSTQTPSTQSSHPVQFAWLSVHTPPTQSWHPGQLPLVSHIAQSGPWMQPKALAGGPFILLTDFTHSPPGTSPTSVMVKISPGLPQVTLSHAATPCPISHLTPKSPVVGSVPHAMGSRGSPNGSVPPVAEPKASQHSGDKPRTQ